MGAILDRIFKVETEGQPVLGSYMYPLRLLEQPPDWNDSDGAIEIIREVDITGLGAAGESILVSRLGGLFIPIPAQFARMDIDNAGPDDFAERLRFRDEVAADLNLVLCEMALREVISEPASPVELAVGLLVDGHAELLGAAGGRETYTKRTLDVAVHVLRGTWRVVARSPGGILDTTSSLTFARTLASMSPTLPLFVTGAYSNFSKHQLPEAISDGWVVVEQIANALWREHLTALGAEGERRRRLQDARDYTAAVRIEVLQQAEILPAELAELMHRGRQERNRMMHRASVSVEAATTVMEAMKQALEHVLQAPVGVPLVARYVDY